MDLSPLCFWSVALTKLQAVPHNRNRALGFLGSEPRSCSGGERGRAGGPRCGLGAGLRAGRLCSGLVAGLVSCRTDQLGMFTHKELEQLGPVLDGFSLMTYDYPTAQQ